jgi:phosphoglycerol transferase MdoB-like AlkP superfamily enzyme
MNGILNEKRLTIINFVIVAFFAIIYLTYYFNIDFVLLGVFREMFFFLFIVAQIPVLLLGILFIVKEKKFSFLMILSTVLLAVCTILTIGSFFF